VTKAPISSTTSSSHASTGTALVLFSAVMWGTWSLWFRPTELSGRTTAPFVFACITLSSIPLMVREHARRTEPIRWTPRVLAMLAAFTFFDALNAATFFHAMTVTTVAVAVLTHDLAPVLVALLAPRVDGVKVPGAGLAAALALGGVMLLLEPWREGALGGDVLLGAGLGLVSAVAYAGNVFLGRKLTLELGTATTLGVHAFGALLLLLPLAGSELLAIEARDVPYLAFAGLVPGAGRLGDPEDRRRHPSAGRAGPQVCNLTVGDFDPKQFPIPEALQQAVLRRSRQHETNYPPANGMLELRHALQRYYERDLGLRYPLDSFLVAGGARPVIYGTYRTLVDPGDTVIYPVPSWNNNHYVHMSGARGVQVLCGPRRGSCRPATRC
jgi:drug/metabolite transporter (DMT)-like permease